jgi:hypothetical protein
VLIVVFVACLLCVLVVQMTVMVVMVVMKTYRSSTKKCPLCVRVRVLVRVVPRGGLRCGLVQLG